MSTLTQHAPPEACETGGFAGGIATLAEGKLYALQNPFALDGRVSTYPGSARGYSVANCYLLTHRDAALLIDTGFGKDEPVIRAQIESLIAPQLPLSLFPLRLNEFMSINNVEAFAGHFNVEQCYTSNIDAACGSISAPRADGRNILESMKVTAVTRADTIEVGGKDRPIDVMNAPIQPDRHALLYDRATRTLFSSDLFTHVWRDRANGPWFVTDENDTTTEREAALLHAQHALLVAGGRADRLESDAASAMCFDKYDIETIAARLWLHPARAQGGGAALPHARTNFSRPVTRAWPVSRYVTRDEER